MSIKSFVFILLISSLTLGFTPSVSATNLQKVIQEAADGAVIAIEEGVYEGPIFIDKPVTIIGEGEVIITNRAEEQTIVVSGNNVTLKNLVIEHKNDDPSTKALFVQGDNHLLEDLTINSSAMGISLEKANNNVLNKIWIHGPYQTIDHQGSMLSRQANGIDLFFANDNQIKNSTLTYVQDGVYIESSSRNIIENVNVSNSRYGFHLMFTEFTKLKSNVSTNNITGAMVMETKGTQLIGNELKKQSNHVYSQGLMLYDVLDATIKHNRIKENLIGLLIENANQNEIESNEFVGNYIGLQVSKSEKNDIVHNDFISNVIHAYGVQSSENRIVDNYWEGQQTIDFTGDGNNNLPFYADPIFPQLVTNKPAYQIFADSPGLLFLKLVLDLKQNVLLTDEQPAIAPNHFEQIQQDEMPLQNLFTYLLIMFFTISIMYTGGRKK